MTSAEEIQREAAEAAQILEHPAFISSIGKLEEVYFRRLRNSKHEEQSLREDCYYMLRAIEELQRALTHTRDKAKTLRSEANGRHRSVV